MSERPGTRLGDVARRLLGGIDRHGNLERARAVAVWEEVAGPEVSRHATGYAMRETELVVFVDTAVWASELSALSEQYRTAVNELLGQEMVGSIRFTVSRRTRMRSGHDEDAASPDGTAGDERAAPVLLDKGEEARLAEMAGAIHDERLREAALAAAKRHLEWQKGLGGPKTP